MALRSSFLPKVISPAAGFPRPLKKSIPTVKCVQSSDHSESVTSIQISKRALTLTSIALGASSILVSAESASAAYGQSANIFAPPKGKTDFIPVTGNGFSLDVPAKWNPSKEIEFSGTVLRYEDNFDATNNLSVLVLPSSKNSVEEYGGTAGFLNEFNYLFGVQTFSGETASEGGFSNNSVVTASLLSEDEVESNGTKYLKLHALTRTADGDEGGKHQLITAAVSGSNLYILKLQAGDKRWFKGAKKYVEGAANSFAIVA